MSGPILECKRQDTGQVVAINVDHIAVVAHYNPELKLKPKETLKNVCVVVMSCGMVMPLSIGLEKLVGMMNARG